MRIRSLSILLALAVTTLGSLGTTDCSEQVVDGLLRTVADHEDRIDALERCECEGVLAPVCGENGKTYVNLCEARCAGTEIASIGPCRRPECGGPHGTTCDEGEFCETHPGCDALAPGSCEPIPQVCTQEADPVCGCDGKTYSNDCARRAAGVGLDFRNACDQAPRSCETNESCEDTEYCHKREGVCDAHAGVCIPRPEQCTLDYAPVCGCDGETYSNACAAAGAGVSVQYDGECKPGPVACDDNAACGTDEFCKKRVGQCEAEGRCVPRPEACLLYVDAVCGCDGETYGNACEAAAAGASLASDEACRSQGEPICHIPPGNPGNRHTIVVGASAVAAHLRHGDYRGPCVEGGGPKH